MDDCGVPNGGTIECRATSEVEGAKEEVRTAREEVRTEKVMPVREVPVVA